jgi:hypothetical protein
MYATSTVVSGPAELLPQHVEHADHRPVPVDSVHPLFLVDSALWFDFHARATRREPFRDTA